MRHPRTPDEVLYITLSVILVFMICFTLVQLAGYCIAKFSRAASNWLKAKFEWRRR